MGRVLHLGPSWHGTSFIWAELAWAELVLGRDVLHPYRQILVVFAFGNGSSCPPTIQAVLTSSFGH